MQTLTRQTKETAIKASLDLYGQGKANIQTGIGFFDHMLDALTRHSLMNLDLKSEGDTHIDYHHSVEDVGIVIGGLLAKELFPVQNIERFSSEIVILDEAAVEVCIDISGRSFLHYDIDMYGEIKDFDIELVEEFFRSLVSNAKIGVHVVLRRGKNKHHVVEAAFKAFGIALRKATTKNERIVMIPSTKESL